MKKAIKKTFCLLVTAATVLTYAGFASANAATGCLHSHGVETYGTYLYTTTVTVGFVCPYSGQYEQCTEKRDIDRLDKVCVDCRYVIGNTEGYRIRSHSNSHCTWTDKTE